MPTNGDIVFRLLPTSTPKRAARGQEWNTLGQSLSGIGTRNTARPSVWLRSGKCLH